MFSCLLVFKIRSLERVLSRNIFFWPDFNFFLTLIFCIFLTSLLGQHFTLNKVTRINTEYRAIFQENNWFPEENISIWPNLHHFLNFDFLYLKVIKTKRSWRFWWTPVKWRRPFTLGAAILEHNKKTFSLGRTKL